MKISFMKNDFEQRDFESKMILNENHFFSKVICYKIIFSQNRFFIKSFSFTNDCL
jgi:hypothetical protein